MVFSLLTVHNLGKLQKQENDIIMDVCLATLGVTLPVAFQGRRKLVLKQQACVAEGLPKSLGECHRDSLLILSERALKKAAFTLPKSLDSYHQKEDDDTASTQSLTTSEEDDSCISPIEESSSSSRLVSFAEPLVTEIHYRPYTTKAEKYALYYDEYDYSDFKIAFITGKSRNRKVNFSHEVVSEVHVFKPASKQERKELYYSEPELQR